MNPSTRAARAVVHANSSHKLFGHFLLLVLLATGLLAGPATAQVLINEVDADQVGTDAAEFVELFDGGGGNTALDGLVLVFFNGSDDASYEAFDLDGQTTDGSGYFVLCGDAANVTNCDLDVSPNTNLIQNGADAVALYTGDATSFPEDTPVTTDALIDAVVYDTSDGDDAGLLVLLNPAEPQVNEGGDGNSTAHSNQRCPNGTGGARNTSTYAQYIPTPGVVNSCVPPVGKLVINEVDYDQDGTDAAEFVEITNSGNASVDLAGHSLVLVNGSGATSYVTVDLPSVSLAPGDFYVVCGDAANVYNCDLDISPDTNLIQNGAPDAVAIFEGETLLDTVSYEGDTGAPYTEGSGSGLEDSSSADYIGISRSPDSADTDVNNVDFSPRCITPGMVNTLDNTDCTDPTPVLSGTLVINEIDYDQSGTDAAEFIEIANAGDSPANLTGHSLVLVNGSNATSYNTIDLPAVVVPAGGFFVVCGNSANVYNCDYDISPDTNLIQNGAPDAVALYLGEVLLDTVSYEGDVAAPYTEGSGSGLTDSTTAYVGISRSPDSTDTDVNNVDFSPRCVTPGMVNTLDNADCTDPTPPPLVINEIDYDQPSSDTAEFVEIANAGNSAASLGGVTLVLINGSGATPYNTIALPDVSLAAYDFFVVCANAATVANCDLDASPDTNFLQNGAPEAVALMRGDELLDTVSYEGDTGAPYTEGSGSGLEDSGATGNDNMSISRFPNGTDTNQNNVDFVASCITPGQVNTSLTTDCSATGPTLEIFEIQGSGETSAYHIQGVTTLDNIVTAVGPQEFFMQTPPERSDADVDTSDGIRVYTGVAPGVAVGDRVDVTGMVYENYGLTSITGSPVVTVNSSGNPLPAPVVLNGSVPSPDPDVPSCAIEFECYENMLVSIANGVVTGGNQDFGSDPIAEVYISAAGNRSYREPGIEYPGLGGSIPTWDTNPEVFELDPDKLGLLNQAIYGGSTFSATGVIGFEYSGYEFWPTELTVSPAPLPMAVRAKAQGEVTIGSLNLFRVCDGKDECDMRLVKFSAYVRDVLLAPDVLAVQEAFDLATLQALADQIAADDPGVSYTPYLIEGNDIGGIDVGFLVRDSFIVDSVAQLGAGELLAYDNSLLHDRPPLLLEGEYVGNGHAFAIAVLVVHNRSLNSIESERTQLKRLAQAESIATMVQDFQTSKPYVPLVVTGDFNAFEFTDGYVDVIGHIKGDFNPAESLRSGADLVSPDLVNQVDLLDPAQRYSFIYEGNAQALDHALTSSAASQWVRGMAFGRANADGAHDQINHPFTAIRSSDHDGLVLFMMTDYDGDGVADDVDGCPMNQYTDTPNTERGCEVFIPTLSPAGMLLMLVLLGGLGAYTVRYRGSF